MSDYWPNTADLEARLAQVVTECARMIERNKRWGALTDYRAGRHDTAEYLAWFAVGVANSAGVTLDTTRLEAAERMETEA